MELANKASTAAAFNIVRYFILSGGAVWLMWSLKDKVKKYRIQNVDPTTKQMRHDILCSISTAVIQGVLTTIVIFKGNSLIYYDISKYGWFYFFFSAIPMLLILDAYFYFSHRLLHWKPLLKHIHISHHKSKVPTAFSTIAFHPVESLIQWIVFPLLVYTVPIHYNMMIIVFAFTFLVNNLGHLGYEFYPKNFVHHPIFKWSNTSTFHNMHHTHVNCNFGLYFNFWDTFLKTTHPEYKELYDRVTKSH